MVDQNNLIKLKDAFVRGSGGKAISDEVINKIGQILVNEYANKNKKFTLSTVIEIAKKMTTGVKDSKGNDIPVVDHTNSHNPARAWSSTGYSILKRLGVYPLKDKSKS